MCFETKKNKILAITTSSVEHKRIIREYYKQLYPYKFNNLDEINQYLENHKLPKLTQYETDNIKN